MSNESSEGTEAKIQRMHGLIDRISSRGERAVDVETIMQEEHGDGEPIYVVVYADYDGDSVLWVGRGEEAARNAASEAREAIKRKSGRFQDTPWYTADGVCVRREVDRWTWDCCCETLGIAVGRAMH